MAIKIEDALKIDSLVNEGMPLIKIAEKLGYNREFVRRYTKGLVKVITQKSTEITQKPNTGSTAPTSTSYESENSPAGQDILRLVKEELQRFKEQIPTDITNKSLFEFRRDTLGQCRDALSELLVKNQIDLESIEKRIISLEKGLNQARELLIEGREGSGA